MGEEGQEKLFTDEELVILGEKEPDPEPKEPETPPPAEGEKDEKPPEGDKTEPEVSDEEKEAAEAQGYQIVTEKGKTYFVDDEGAKIPAKRFRSVYREGQENKRLAEEKDRKFNLFKELGAEKYYELYPEEKPADFKPAEKPKEKPAEETFDIGFMVVRGGPHDGKTLNEVWEEDPRAAYRLEAQYREEQAKTKREQEASEAKRLEDSNREIDAFTVQMSKELFGKEPDKLSPKEEQKVTATIESTLNWMAKTGRGGGVIADAYFLMNSERILSDARAKGGREALAALNKPGLPSVNTSGGTSVTGFSSYEEMSADQLAAEVEKMDEKKYQKFMKEAPQALRQKHPGLPWS